MFSIAQIKTEKLIFLLKTMFYIVKNIKANSNSQNKICFRVRVTPVEYIAQLMNETRMCF